MCNIGDIVRIYSGPAGHVKYHLCIRAPKGEEAACFLFLNSDPSFQQLFVVACARVPCLPTSKTGKTAFSFSMIPRYNRKQLKLHQATIMGQIDKQLAYDLFVHAKAVTVMTSTERTMVLHALKTLSE
jgi:hypothetical protein